MTNREFEFRRQVAAVALTWRLRARQSVNEAATDLGLSAIELEEIEAGRSSIPCDILYAMLNIYGVSDKDFAGFLEMAARLHGQKMLSE
jgi:transcriptional regulator with XRE-family HTH domain